MAINLILPDEITTSAQREKVDKMMRELQDYRMKPEEDIVQHLITVNQKMQEALWTDLVLKMDNQFFVYVYFDGVMLTTIVGCIFDCCKQIAMRFNRNVLFDDMKERISAKIVRHYGRRISKLFYKFLVLTNPIKFTKIELVDDEDVETMVALYCANQNDQNAPIQLFAKLAGVEPTEDPTPLGKEHEAQELCITVPISTDIDLNAATKIDFVGDDVYNSCDLSDHEVDSDSDPDVDEVPDDIDDEGVNDDRNVNASIVKN
ncbi:hypothetical protein J1N35_007927 [Gossypium stocksii]|uniref:Uncharacterized protein n=1 Tax=Gossypium stocksii TaxID=47602 RepID=A0A9D3W6X3_9ROSI|nr:hypothetical protein J1N35_007927 [Gossypium stocksii]